MAKRKITVTVDENLVEAAKVGSESLSAVVNSALAAEVDRRARAAALHRKLAEWEAEFGPIASEAAATARRAFDDLDGLADSHDGHPGDRHEVA